jgi:hypothetical protein
MYWMELRLGISMYWLSMAAASRVVGKLAVRTCMLVGKAVLHGWQSLRWWHNGCQGYTGWPPWLVTCSGLSGMRQSELYTNLALVVVWGLY